MSQYYFVAAALPSIVLGIKAEVSFQEVKEMLELNLTEEDLKSVERLLRPIDLYNIRAFWLGFPFDDKGNFSAHDLEEALLVRDQLPSYLVDYLERYESTEERLRNFSSLHASLYREEQPKLRGFLLKYYQFERALRLILTALRAKRLERDLIKELQFEDPLDPLVMEMLVQKDAEEYTPPREFEDLKAIFEESGSEPLKLHRAISEYRFRKIEEMEENDHFSLDHILGYLARLLIVESWSGLDRERGGAAVEQLIRYG